ncbi:MAG: FKBP-type peptidyl-prolyl cis-trans isomerase, partial [Bacteroidota bacterium]
MDSLSYSVGVLIGKSLINQGITELDSVVFAKAVADVLNDRQLEIDPAQANAIFQEFAQKAKMKQFEAVVAKGKAFLEENAKKDSVITLPSGLQYKELVAGEGENPSATSRVTVNYEGKLLDGTVFDSSYKRGEPTSFGVNQVIPGWTEGLQLMKPGAKWELYIPYNLAYGERGAGGAIGPYETLI